jgi:hypothetical protein
VYVALFRKRPAKPAKRDPQQREREAGAREYEARRQDRLAARYEAEGDIERHKTARDAADEMRRPRSPRTGE